MAKIKHIALTTKDPEKVAAFYKEAFDLQEIRRSPNGAVRAGATTHPEGGIRCNAGPGEPPQFRDEVGGPRWGGHRHLPYRLGRHRLSPEASGAITGMAPARNHCRAPIWQHRTLCLPLPLALWERVRVREEGAQTKE